MCSSDLAALEAQLRESQKMEALGTLAGGIAHEFNNALAVVSGNVELARQDVGTGHLAHESLDEIDKASNRAKALVQQILTFGRRQVRERKRIALAPVLEESVELLRATQPAGVTFSLACTADVPQVFADAQQIEQVVINLCTNAWHAIQDQKRAGTIVIELAAYDYTTGSAMAQPAAFMLGHLQPGIYARLTVRDNGAGMNQVTLRRIFEPFFTTKPMGKGTGLGMAVVHGILQEHEAIVAVDSALGAGTTFQIYLPAAGPAPDDAPAVGSTGLGRAGGGTQKGGMLSKHILYVDDDQLLVSLITRLLERRGYRVSGYIDPQEALRVFHADPSAFNVIITDYNMPGTTGLDLAREITQTHPEVPVAVVSGYVTEELREQLLAAGASEVIHKTDSVQELCDAVSRLANVS